LTHAGARGAAEHELGMGPATKLPTGSSPTGPLATARPALRPTATRLRARVRRHATRIDALSIET
jgi:hypothetical protein